MWLIILGFFPKLCFLFGILRYLRPENFHTPYDNYFMLIMLGFDMVINTLFAIWWTQGDDK